METIKTATHQLTLEVPDAMRCIHKHGNPLNYFSMGMNPEDLIMFMTMNKVDAMIQPKGDETWSINVQVIADEAVVTADEVRAQCAAWGETVTSLEAQGNWMIARTYSSAAVNLTVYSLRYHKNENGAGLWITLFGDNRQAVEGCRSMLDKLADSACLTRA